MPKTDLADETRAEMQQAGPVDLLIGISGGASVQELQQRVHGLLDGLQKRAGVARLAIAYPANGEGEGFTRDADKDTARFMPYSLAASDSAGLPWIIFSAALKAVSSLAVDLNAKACVLLHGDLEMLTAERLELLTQPIQEKQCDLAMPVYPSRKLDGLLNYSVLAPLARALYGPRVRYPLAQDIGCSARMCQKLSESHRTRERSEAALLWPVTSAAISNYQVCQANVDVHHAAQTEGLELSEVLTSLAGSAFAEMEAYAPYWQRVRNSQPTATSGSIAQQISDGEPVDAKPLIDSFVLGSRNLQEIWGLVLPPVTLLELKKLARCAPESFRLPDELWARIVYDFALAYRLRTINRGHLMGALTPLYLGWVASYVQEVAARSPLAAEQRFEQLARAYEEAKPYLVSRWRWPDRFNP
jgi:glucosylglycerate synthase